MLIDASHPEETRVVVLDGQKVEEFDFEAAAKRPLKGNIYLAKVTRVEPSLQAAFVEYGGNRQGFLAFSEIHPDYYQIPVADRQALLAEQEAEARRRADEEIESFDIAPGPKPEMAEDESEEVEASAPEDEIATEPPPDGLAEEGIVDVQAASAPDDDIFDNHAAHEEPVEDDAAEHMDAAPQDESAALQEAAEATAADPHSEGEFESDAEQATETPAQHGEGEQPQQSKPLQAQRPPQRFLRKRHYKIQEVIKRRQIILVQVVKEERGNKGAALTTYLSLAGRYCVLMPNTPRGGGISRKITNANDRKRLKSAAQALELPEGMGLIIRTAGESRTKVEIKRDYEYLLRTWDAIRELTLQSNAPACVYEEGDLIKRAIRDLYNKDVGEIIVEGDEGYRNAKEFMRMLMPSHAKNVKLYREPVPLFQRHHIEAQLDAMFSSTVTLKSGGYIVINQTEALVSIDVNSGRATREHSIEETARKTNLEAADEIGRQLRLRDLAGLIVIDFIDMEDGRNDRDVEKRMRDAVKNDRARVQIGKISQFGLLEMSRQRLRAGVIAGSTVPCPHCGGQGIVRAVESTALRLLRGLEEEGQKLKASAVVVRVAADVAIYTLNQKRRELARIENDYQMSITFEPKEGLMVGTFEIERTVQKTAEESAKLAAAFKTEFVPPPAEEEPEDVVEVEEEAEEIESEELAEAPQADAAQQQQQGSSSKRRRRRRGGRGNGNGERQPQAQGQPHHERHQASVGQPSVAQPAAELADPALEFAAEEGFVPVQDGQPPAADGQPRRKRRRRRGRRGGRSGEQSAAQGDNGSALSGSDDAEIEKPEDGDSIATPNGSSTPVWSFQNEATQAVSHPPETIAATVEPPEPERMAEPEPADEREPEPAEAAAEPAPEPRPAGPAGPAKKGWWQRTFRSEG
ncbi:MAG: Rne/Rng family ribonuclease [Alphaproteobacteria bacterium]|nr:Rne/Rng family ribonuclease [Alphaproteobacteria bacterium]